MSDTKPILWHIPVSHYSEKVRWALDHKRIEHERRAPMPGAHMAVALWLTRGKHKTFPVVRIDGRNVGDSSEIIAELDRCRPEHPLLPSDPDERRRALALEEFFDERLGAQIRLLGWHELRTDKQRMTEVASQMAPGPLRDLPGSDAFARAFGSTFVQLRYRVASDEAAARARAAVVAASSSEFDAAGGEYLVGDRFSVADLTAAALFYPLVNPPEGPQVLPGDPPAGTNEAGLRWRRNISSTHR